MLSAKEIDLLDAYWRASNYLTVGRIYLMANPLLREPHHREPARELVEMTNTALAVHRKYVVEHLEDMPAIRDWKWTLA